MMSTRLHTKAADLAALLEVDKVSPATSATAEDGAPIDTGEFAATLQDLIDSYGGKESDPGTDSSVVLSPSSPEEASHQATTTSTTGGSERLVNSARAPIATITRTASSAPNSKYVVPWSTEGARAYQSSVDAAEPVLAAADKIANVNEPKKQSIPSNDPPSSAVKTARSTLEPRLADSAISIHPVVRDKESANNQTTLPTTSLVAAAPRLKPSSSKSTDITEAASGRDDSSARPTIAVARQSYSQHQDAGASVSRKSAGSTPSDLEPKPTDSAIVRYPLVREKDSTNNQDILPTTSLVGASTRLKPSSSKSTDVTEVASGHRDFSATPTIVVARKSYSQLQEAGASGSRKSKGSTISDLEPRLADSAISEWPALRDKESTNNQETLPTASPIDGKPRITPSSSKSTNIAEVASGRDDSSATPNTSVARQSYSQHQEADASVRRKSADSATLDLNPIVARSNVQSPPSSTVAIESASSPTRPTDSDSRQSTVSSSRAIDMLGTRIVKDFDNAPISSGNAPVAPSVASNSISHPDSHKDAAAPQTTIGASSPTDALNHGTVILATPTMTEDTNNRTATAKPNGEELSNLSEYTSPGIGNSSLKSASADGHSNTEAPTNQQKRFQKVSDVHVTPPASRAVSMNDTPRASDGGERKQSYPSLASSADSVTYEPARSAPPKVSTSVLQQNGVTNDRIPIAPLDSHNRSDETTGYVPTVSLPAGQSLSFKPTQSRSAVEVSVRAVERSNTLASKATSHESTSSEVPAEPTSSIVHTTTVDSIFNAIDDKSEVKPDNNLADGAAMPGRADEGVVNGSLAPVVSPGAKHLAPSTTDYDRRTQTPGAAEMPPPSEAAGTSHSQRNTREATSNSAKSLSMNTVGTEVARDPIDITVSPPTFRPVQLESRTTESSETAPAVTSAVPRSTDLNVPIPAANQHDDRPVTLESEDDDSSVSADNAHTATVSEQGQVHRSAAVDDANTTFSNPAEADIHQSRFLEVSAKDDVSVAPQTTNTPASATFPTESSGVASLIAMKQDKTQVPDPMVTSEGVLRTDQSPSPGRSTETAPIRLVQEVTPAIEPVRVASLKVELANGELAQATVRERAGSIEVKIVTPTSASAQRVSGEIDTMRQNLDAAGMRLGQTEVSYQPGGNGGRGGNRDQRQAQQESSTKDEQIFSMGEVTE